MTLNLARFVSKGLIDPEAPFDPQVSQPTKPQLAHAQFRGRKSVPPSRSILCKAGRWRRFRFAVPFLAFPTGKTSLATLLRLFFSQSMPLFGVPTQNQRLSASLPNGAGTRLYMCNYYAHATPTFHISARCAPLQRPCPEVPQSTAFLLTASRSFQKPARNSRRELELFQSQKFNFESPVLLF